MHDFTQEAEAGFVFVVFVNTTGVGIAIDNFSPNYQPAIDYKQDSFFSHGIIKSTSSVSFCFSGGLRVGFLIGDFWKKKKEN